MNQYKLNRFAVMTRLEVTGLMNIEGRKIKAPILHKKLREPHQEVTRTKRLKMQEMSVTTKKSAAVKCQIMGKYSKLIIALAW
jgi:serine/threonine protein kinase HipA of HipAB toxin-antitoxin module